MQEEQNNQDVVKEKKAREIPREKKKKTEQLVQYVVMECESEILVAIENIEMGIEIETEKEGEKGRREEREG